MEDLFDDEKIGIRKIRLLNPERATLAVVGSFSDANDYLTQWRSASNGRLRCRFEIEYVDEHVLCGEYRSSWAKAGRVSLSVHIRSMVQKMLKRDESTPRPARAVDHIGLQLWLGPSAWQFANDFLDRYET